MQKFDSLFKSKNIFFLAIIIFTLSSFTLYYNRDDIFKLFKNDTKTLSQNSEIIPEEPATPSVKEKKQEAPLLSSKTLLNYVSNLKFPESPPVSVEPKLNPVPKSYSIDYVQYLLNVNLLVYNFLQNKDYDKELAVIKLSILPQEINNIITSLEEYNHYLISESEEPNLVFPTNRKWLEKFIKIEKKPSNAIKQEQEKLLISEKLKYLIDFLYSEKFMQEFVNKDV
ncbi:MAG TPA: hypothetical protein LFW21_05345 [Rickettsia endosymbiont of Pyrocoelia pectoralis]|nr:hypothetical protein [Rickettsia endosymbiont of Pyrocoelia pectoralis]